MLNKNHQDYPKFKKECDELRTTYLQKLDELESKFHQTHGKDGLSNQINKEFALEFKKLQNKYSYLYYDD